MTTRTARAGLGARTGDRFGHRKVLSGVIVLFGVACALAAVAPWPSALAVSQGL